MTTTIHKPSALGKFSAVLFTRQKQYATAERHPGLLDALRAWRQRRAAVSELFRLSDRTLADIGLTRQGIYAAVRVHGAGR